MPVLAISPRIETVRRLGGRYRLERVGRERLKNLTEAIEVHRIISPPSRR